MAYFKLNFHQVSASKIINFIFYIFIYFNEIERKLTYRKPYFGTYFNNMSFLYLLNIYGIRTHQILDTTSNNSQALTCVEKYILLCCKQRIKVPPNLVTKFHVYSPSIVTSIKIMQRCIFNLYIVTVIRFIETNLSIMQK